MGGDPLLLQKLEDMVGHAVVDGSLADDGALFQTVHGSGVILIIYDQDVRIFCCINLFCFSFVQ